MVTVRHPKNRLTAQRIRELKSPGLYADGNGLYVRVERSGSKRFVQRITVKGGKRHALGLGSVDVISLRDAREMARTNKQQARQGIDPLAEKRRKAMPTFRDAAAEAWQFKRQSWTSEHHASRWWASLERHAFPKLGDIPVNQVSRADVVAVLTPIWHTERDMATRVRQHISAVLDWADLHDFREGNPVAGKALDAALGKTRPPVKHHPAVPYDQVGNAILKVRHSRANPATILSLEFLIFTIARSSEVRLATWDEIDVESRQ